LNKRQIILLSIFILLVLIFFVSKNFYSPFPGGQDEAIIEHFHKIYHSKYQVHWRTYWLGTKIVQNPMDMWSTQEIIYDIKPDFIIETGTYHGGASLFFAFVLHNVNENGKVITVDINPQTEKAEKHWLFQKYVKVIKGNSVSEDVINEIKKLVSGSKVIVTLDSNHSKNHVLKEMQLYSKLVSLNSYLIVQDGNLNGHPVRPNFGEGPMEAIQEFLKFNDNFSIDRNREKYLFTYYPNGYLKRIK
jgi:cephalosporin hydroxylase